MDDFEAKRLVLALEDQEAAPEQALPADLEAVAAEQRNIRRLLAATPSEDPGPGFAAAVMARLLLAPAPWYRRLGTWLWRPRQFSLRWNLGTAGLFLVAAASPAALFLMRSAPEADAEGRAITLVFVAPQAKNVSLAGDFNDWQPARQPMRDEAGDGVWTTTIRLAPGRYEYMFVVNGEEWVPDPLARVRRPDGFGRENAVLDL
jgi:hypothetical protein